MLERVVEKKKFPRNLYSNSMKMIMSDPEDVATMTGPGEDLEPHPDDTVYKRATEEPWDVLHSIA